MTQTNNANQLQPSGRVLAVSRDGYTFELAANSWKLNKDVSIPLAFTEELPEPTKSSFRATLQRYAEELSARHAANISKRFRRFLLDANTLTIDSTSLINWRAMLGEREQHHLGGLKGFLLAWHDYGFPGVTDEVAQLLRGWRIKGNDKGVAVKSGCSRSGPFTDLEITAILDWANKAVSARMISFRDYAYLLTVAMTARRPIQIAALRGRDLIEETGKNTRLVRVSFPRAKQRGGSFRRTFRSLAVADDLYQVLCHQHQLSLAMVEAELSQPLVDDLKQEIPVFLCRSSLSRLSSSTTLESLLLGPAPDLLHERTDALSQSLRDMAKLCTARSERTGEFIRLSATRFRYTRGTKLRREGFGPFVIAELLDHSDVQNVGVYTENTAEEAVKIDALVGAKLAPFAQACQGTLVWSEREAVRGDDPRSRVANHQQNPTGTCGNYGFCASGYRACYTCHHFQPWVHGPHDEVLIELYAEKERTRQVGCAEEVVNANDQLILAVEHCVSLCETARSKEKMTQRADLEIHG